ncbi:MAG: hypothetical protein HYV02_01150 [Deltaproteobacteria bacterium]|nr:hypothetical protein [Deltaproteobacteria bacterium]
MTPGPRIAADMQRADALYRHYVTEVPWRFLPIQDGLTMLDTAVTEDTPRVDASYDGPLASDDPAALFAIDISQYHRTREAIVINKILSDFDRASRASETYLTIVAEAVFDRLVQSESGSVEWKFLAEMDRSAMAMADEAGVEIARYRKILCCMVIKAHLRALGRIRDVFEQMCAIREAPWFFALLIEICLGPLKDAIAHDARRWEAFWGTTKTFAAFVELLDRLPNDLLRPIDKGIVNQLRTLYPNIPYVLRGYRILEPSFLPFPFNAALRHKNDPDNFGSYCKFPVFIVRDASDRTAEEKRRTIRHEAIHSLVGTARIAHLLTALYIRNHNLERLFAEGITELLTRHAGEVLDAEATEARAVTPEALIQQRHSDFAHTLQAVQQIPGDFYSVAVTLAIGLARRLGFPRFLALFTAAQYQAGYALTPEEIAALQPIFQQLGTRIDQAVTNSSEAPFLPHDVAEEVFTMLQGDGS